MFKLAFGHKARCGKDTAAEYIEKILIQKGYKVKKLKFAKYIYEISEFIQKYLNKPIIKDPNLLQLLGNSLRNLYDLNIWVDALYKEYIQSINDGYNIIIITDLRYPNEYDMLKNLGFIFIKINRLNRIIDRDPNHISEIALNNHNFDIIIDNNGSIDEYINNINDKLLKNIFNF